MTESLLRQLSDARAALAGSLATRTLAVAASARRTVSAIRWRGPYLISAAEALAGAERVRLYAPSTSAGSAGAGCMMEAQGEIVAADLSTDVAVIRASEAICASLAVRTNDAPVAEPTAAASASAASTSVAQPPAALRLGQSVAIVGCHRDGAMAAWGSVCLAGPAWRSRRGGDIDQRLEFAAEVDARLEGALIATTEGHIAAMLVLGPRGRPLGIPAVTIERVLGRVEQHGYLPRPYLGLRLQALWLDAPAAARFARRSARVPVVAGVDPGSPAAAAGLEPGDLIETIDDSELDGVDALRGALARTDIGVALRLGVRRGGVAQTRTLTVGQRPRPSPAPPPHPGPRPAQ